MKKGSGERTPPVGEPSGVKEVGGGTERESLNLPPGKYQVRLDFPPIQEGVSEYRVQLCVLDERSPEVAEGLKDSVMRSAFKAGDQVVRAFRPGAPESFETLTVRSVNYLNDGLDESSFRPVEDVLTDHRSA